MLLWSFKTVKERQLFWTAFCALSLLECVVSSDGTSTTPHVSFSTEPNTSQPTAASISSNNIQHSTTSQHLVYSTTSNAQEKASTNPTVTDVNTNRSDVEDNNKTTTTPTIEQTTNKIIKDSSTTSITSNPENVISLKTTVQSNYLPKSTSGTSSNATQTKTSAEFWTSSPSKLSSIKCVKIKEVTSHSNAICLEANEIQTCKYLYDAPLHNSLGAALGQDYVRMKGNVLEEIFCEKQSCHIKLAETNEHHGCNLFVGVNGKGADALHDILASHTSALTKIRWCCPVCHHCFQDERGYCGKEDSIADQCYRKDNDARKCPVWPFQDCCTLGMKTYKKVNIESHKDYSRKTLIALVTSGLLLAFLGLAAYHFMKRRSWSPMGERLGEDPYYTENDSHGNPVSSVASHEHSDLQEKPNINGGARENGTGQASSKNGQSGRPHIADTEL